MARGVVAELNLVGLKELRGALRRFGGELPGELREGLKGAADIAVQDIRGQMPKRTGRAASSVRSVSSGNTIFIKGGGARVPYFGWLEFGGNLPPRRPRNKKALAWAGAAHPVASAKGPSLPKVREGRYIRPTIARRMPEIVEAAADATDEAMRKAGLK